MKNCAILTKRKIMEKILLGRTPGSTFEFAGELIASSDWQDEIQDLTGYVRIYLSQDGRILTYSEQWDVDDSIRTNVEMNFHITLIEELAAAKNRGFFAKLILGDVLKTIRNELRRGVPIEIESNDMIKELATKIAKKLGFFAEIKQAGASKVAKSLADAGFYPRR